MVTTTTVRSDLDGETTDDLAKRESYTRRESRTNAIPDQTVTIETGERDADGEPVLNPDGSRPTEVRALGWDISNQTKDITRTRFADRAVVTEQTTAVRYPADLDGDGTIEADEQALDLTVVIADLASAAGSPPLGAFSDGTTWSTVRTDESLVLNGYTDPDTGTTKTIDYRATGQESTTTDFDSETGGEGPELSRTVITLTGLDANDEQLDETAIDAAATTTITADNWSRSNVEAAGTFDGVERLRTTADDRAGADPRRSG